MPCPRRGIVGAHRQGQGAKGTVWFLPLLTPKPSFAPRLPSVARRNRVRGLGSGRLSAYGTLYRPEFTLRKPPRITVRGQTVQGACTPLRKAPLRSKAYPWSTRRPCGPSHLDARPEESRPKRVWGVKREREPSVPCPLLSPPPDGGNATPCHGEHPPPGDGLASTGCTAVSARRKALGRAAFAIK